MDVNWRGIEDRIFTYNSEAISHFAAEHPEVVWPFFAFDVDLPYLLLSVDTPTNTIQMARRTEQEAIAQRAKMPALPAAWQWLGISLRNPNTGLRL